MNISDVFEKILLKPELYLGAQSVMRLWAHLKGYMAALDDAQLPYEDKEFGAFCRWVESKYDLRTNHSWADVVLFMSFGDECRAIEMTRSLWSEFKAHMALLTSSDFRPQDYR